MEQHKQQSSNQTPPAGGRVGSRHLPAGGGDRFSQSMSEKRGRNMQGIHIFIGSFYMKSCHKHSDNSSFSFGWLAVYTRT